MNEVLNNYRKEMQQELENILAYWMRYTVDVDNGGFYGKIDNDNRVYKDAPKGLVLNSRILWTFSAAFTKTKNPRHLAIADRAFNYIQHHFIDKEFGGAYWTVDYKGNSLDTKKQIYAIAFAVYGLSEYYGATKNDQALQQATALYRSIVEHSYDTSKGGYIEALTRDWKEINDLRLSSKDSNEKKSMNTHLHILEAFANLYRVRPDEVLKRQITELIYIFLDRIIDGETNHLVLFFDEDWKPKSDIISYGHDIEAAWLVQEAAEIIHDEELVDKVKARSVKVAEAATRGLDDDGGLWYEKEVAENRLVKDKHWWPQAEAMVGFYNAFQITGNIDFCMKSINSWRFVQKHILDKQGGEWYWGVKEDYSIMQGEDKAGLWKCPYHNGRACLEILKRIGEE